MKVKAIARWATLIGALSAPVIVFANNDKQDTTKTTDTSKSTDTSKTANKEKLSDAEMQILAHYHHVNQEEIDMGKMAQKMGATKAVKDYGAMLVKDHSQNDKQLTAFAKKQGVTIPKEKPANEAEQTEMKQSQDEMKKLRTMKGADFDREFLQTMVTDHEKELAKIDTNMSAATNPDLAQLIRDTKPMLQKHADDARDLEKTNAQAAK